MGSGWQFGGSNVRQFTRHMTVALNLLASLWGRYKELLVRAKLACWKPANYAEQDSDIAAICEIVEMVPRFGA